MTYILENEPETYEEAMIIAKRNDKLPLGVIWRRNKPVFHEELYGELNPIINSLSKEKRIGLINEILRSR